MTMLAAPDKNNPRYDASPILNLNCLKHFLGDSSAFATSPLPIANGDATRRIRLPENWTTCNIIGVVSG